MKIPSVVPAVLCIVAGVLLCGDAVLSYFSHDASTFGSSQDFDIFSFAVGLYFVGKGLFIHNILTMFSEFKQSR